MHVFWCYLGQITIIIGQIKQLINYFTKIGEETALTKGVICDEFSEQHQH